MIIYFIGILFIVLSGFIALLFKNNLKTLVTTIWASLGLITCGAFAFLTAGAEKLVEFKISNFNPIMGDIVFRLDLLSSVFAGIISVIGILILIYSNGYLKHYVEKKSLNSHLIFLTTLLASMLMVVVSQNALMFLICWEIMSLSSFFLVIFENDKKEVIKSGIKYLVFMHISVLFIIFAFALIAINAGSFDFVAFKQVLANNSHLSILAFLLAFAGFATKAGLVPFHNWLPDAHPCAPTHVSALMSGVMIKTGIYGILRMITLVDTPSITISYVVLIIGLLSASYGILYAISQEDLKKMLAYSSIENIGIITIGIGVGMLGLAYNYPPIVMLGFLGALLHVINHSIFKSLLFCSAGNLYTKLHTKDIEKMGGLMKVMPRTGLLFLIGSLAISGLPPFNGFISEFMIYASMFIGLGDKNFFIVLSLLFAISVLAFVGAMAIICFSKAFSVIFLGLPRSEEVKEITCDSDKSMLIPMNILGFFIVLIGVFPVILVGNVTPYSIQNLLGVPLHTVDFDMALFVQFLSFMQAVAFISLTLIVFLGALILIKKFITKGKVTIHNTWGCGYNRANNKMQYSASSFASPFLSMFVPLFKNVYDIKKPKKIFPKSAHFAMHTEDFEEAYFIKPIVKFDEWFLSKFETIQSGNIQSYIKYSLIFLLLIIIGSLLIG